jgi:hypothetical protein
VVHALETNASIRPFALGRWDHILAGSRHVQLQCSAKQTPSDASYASVNVFTYTLVPTTPTTPQHLASSTNLYLHPHPPVSESVLSVIVYWLASAQVTSFGISGHLSRLDHHVTCSNRPDHCYLAIFATSALYTQL